jgi:hypothetical protein
MRSLGHFETALRFIDEAVSTLDTTEENCFEANVNRIAGEIACCRQSMMWRKLKRISSVLSQLPVPSRQSPGSYAQR